MKRVRVAKGKHVMVSAELAEKAARVFGTGLTRDITRALAAGAPRRLPALMVGSSKPLAVMKPWAPTNEELAKGSCPSEDAV